MPLAPSFSVTDRTHEDFPADLPVAPKELLDRLRGGGLQVTNVRVAMLAAMARLPAPITLRHLQEQIGPVAFASLYRCMLRFEEIDLVRRSIGFDGTLSWELNPGTPQEFHVACSNTGEAVSLDLESAAELRRVLAKIEHRLHQCGYTHVQLNVAFQGVAQTERFEQTVGTLRQHVA